MKSGTDEENSSEGPKELSRERCLDTGSATDSSPGLKATGDADFATVWPGLALKRLVWTALIALVALLLLRLPLLQGRSFDPDEFEHLHAAWCMSQGMVVYKDFFEHHTPWYYWFVSP